MLAYEYAIHADIQLWIWVGLMSAIFISIVVWAIWWRKSI
jgi:hypothetical protein